MEAIWQFAVKSFLVLKTIAIHCLVRIRAFITGRISGTASFVAFGRLI